MLYGTGDGFVPDIIRDHALVQIHAQAPGAVEEQQGEPKVGPTGRLEEHKFMLLAGLTRQDVSLSNALRCRWIKNGQPTDAAPPPTVLKQALEYCHIAHFQMGPTTQLVVAQGNWAWQQLGGSGSITDWRGHLKPSNLEHLKYINLHSVKVLAMLHPASLHHAPEYTQATAQDWRKVPKVLSGEWPKPLPRFKMLTVDELDSDACTEWWKKAYDAPFIMCDTEYIPKVPSTDSILRLIGIGYPGMEWVYQQQWLNSGEPSWTRARLIENLKRLVAHVPFVFFNALADLAVFESSFGITYDDFTAIHDPMLAHALLYSDYPHDFNFVASCYGWYPRVKHMQDENENVYLTGDVAELEPMHLAMQAELSHDPKLMALYREQSLPLIPILLKAHRTGIAADVEAVKGLMAEYAITMLEAMDLAHAGAGWPINVGSDDQVAYWCYGVQQYALKRHRKTRQPTVNHDAIQSLRQAVGPWFDAEEEERDGLALTACMERIEHGADPVLESRVLYATAQHTMAFYLRPMLAGRIYPDIHQHTQASGRFSTVEPPVAQFPPEVLALLIPDVGEVFIVFDWKQIEPRLQAVLSGDTRTLETLARGGDIYTDACYVAFGRVTPQLRKFAKSNIVLRTNYGGNTRATANLPGLMALNLTATDVSRAASAYDTAHPEAAAWRLRTIEQALRTRISATFTGRRRLLTGSTHEIGKQAVNHQCQGGVRDIANMTMLDIAHQLDYARLVWDRHDEQCWGIPVEREALAAAVIKVAAERPREINGQSVTFPVEMRVVRRADDGGRQV